MVPSPLRLDWRWHHASAALTLPDVQAACWLEDCDELTQRAYDYLVTMRRNLFWSPDRVSMAHELYVGSQQFSPDLRVQVECYLLDPEIPMAEIAAWSRMTPQGLTAYHDLFFETRPAFEQGAIGWLGSQLFRNGLYSPVSSRDQVGRLHRIAWLLGGRVIRAFMSGTKFGNQAPDVRKLILENIRDYMMKLTQLNVMCMSGRGDLDLDLVKVMIDDVNKEAASKVAEQSGPAQGTEILSFLREISVTVADPTDKRNLELPAREPRAADLMKAHPVTV